MALSLEEVRRVVRASLEVQAPLLPESLLHFIANVVWLVLHALQVYYFNPYKTYYQLTTSRVNSVYTVQPQRRTYDAERKQEALCCIFNVIWRKKENLFHMEIMHTTC